MSGGISLWIAGGPAAAQKEPDERTSRVVKTAKSGPSVGRTGGSFAAAENARSLSSLGWGFGGKTQRGWDIYVPLISHTIGTDAPGDSDEFAAVLSGWQSKKGLPATGEMDDATMRSFVSHWQSQRLGKFSAADEAGLLSAPIAEFFDPTRHADLLKLERETYAAYKKMMRAAEKDLGQKIRSGSGVRYLSIVSAYRSPAYQAELRRRAPNSGRAALAKFSAHSTGQALDIYVGGEPVSTKDANRRLQTETAAYKWLVKNAVKFGFFPYFYEPWHWEYVPGR